MSGACPVCGGAAARPVANRWDVPVLACAGCGAGYVHPAPGPAELRRRYDREHGAGKWAALFESAAADEVERRAGLLTTLAGGPGRVLDVGCGNGAFLDAARRAGWRTVGLELSLAAAASVAPAHGRVVGEIEALREASGFDAVTFWDVLEHVGSPAALLRAAVARLRPGGVVALTMPSFVGTSRVFLGGSWPYFDLDRYGHLHHLGPAHAARLLADAGLAVAYRETRGSVDLRDVPAAHGRRAPGRAATWALDRASGLLARAAERTGRGNTLLLVGRRPPRTAAR